MNARWIAAGFVAATAWFVAGAAAEEAESAAARQIIDRAIEAAGGREALKRYEKPFYMKREGKTLNSSGWQQFTMEITTHLPDKIRMEQKRTTSNGTTRELGYRFNGEKGWHIGFDLKGTREMDDAAIRTQRLVLYADWLSTLLPLDDAEFQLSMAEEIAVDKRPAVGVKISRQNWPDVRLYFDAEALTLVKRAIDHNGRLMEQFYGDFSELDGLVYPRTFVSYVDGTKYTEAQTTEFKFLDEVDEAIFEQP